MIELLRRFSLAAGVAAFVWFLLDTPPAVYSIKVADFDKEYAKKYTEPKGRRLFGVMELGQDFIRRNTNPGSAAAYRDRQVEGRLLRTGADATALLAAAENTESLWLSIDDARLAAFLPDLDRAYGATQWLNAYLPVKADGDTRYLEFLRHNRPKDTKAPGALVHPMRSLALPWLGVGLLAYLLLPAVAARRNEAHRDALAIGVLDFAAAAFGGLFFALPFLFHESTREMLDDVAGATGVSWAVAACIALLLAVNASRAALRISVADGNLRIRRLLGDRVISLGEITAVEPLMHGPERTGLLLRLQSGGTEKIEWADLLNADALSQSLNPMRCTR